MKTISAYLAATGITGEAAATASTALQALLTDAQSEITTAQSAAQQAREQVQGEIRESQQARALATAFRKVAEKAGVDLSGLSDSAISQERRRELSDGAAQQVLDFVANAGGDAADASHILQDSGFDLDAYHKAGKEKRAELARTFAEGIKADRAAVKDGARAELLREANLDPKKASAILGDISLEKGKVTVAENGQQVERDTIGIKGADGTFISVEALLKEKGFTPAELTAAPPNTARQEQQPLWVAQPTVTTTTPVTDADLDKARLASGNYTPF